MHEFSIAEDILAIVSQTVGRQRRLSRVHLTLGPLAGLLPDALRFCFADLAQLRGFGTPQLEIEETPARLHCRDCGCEYEITDFAEGCPHCQSFHRDVLSGREFTVDWVEVEG